MRYELASLSAPNRQPGRCRPAIFVEGDGLQPIYWQVSQIPTGVGALKIKSLDQLREPDERTLKFQPIGLGGRMRPADAALYQQEIISHTELVSDVPELVRNYFDQLRTLYAYGVLCYDFFTIAHDQTQLALEFALRARFIEFYGGTVPLSGGRGGACAVQAASFEQLHQVIRRTPGLRLRVQRTGKWIPFDGMLDSLIRWARAEGMLRGQRNRAIEPLLRKFRNQVAHGAGYHLLMPADAARAISDIAEFINHLWGSPTPGGRLYPAPIRRDTQVVGWNSRGDVMAGQIGLLREGQPGECAAPASDQLHAELPGGTSPAEWTWVLVRGVLHDEGLMRFDSLFEVTTYPCEMLWGPGTARDAMAWFEAEQPQADEVGVLDRPFLIQHCGSRLYLPRRPEVAAGMGDAGRQGKWYFVRADHPTDAFGHVRTVAARGPGCSRTGPCQQCAVETVGVGSWDAVASLLKDEGVEIAPHPVPDARVSSAMKWPRYSEILGNGRWVVPAVDDLVIPHP